MSESFFKFLTWGFVILIFFAVFSPSCSKKTDNYKVDVQTVVSAADGLDLQAVGDLLKKAKTAEELEGLLNNEKMGVNNLDLNEDGKVDYIQVDEYGDTGVKGFSLTVDTAAGETQEIATIEIQKSGQYADVQVHGNQHIYGHNHYYHSRFGVTDFLLLSYLMRPHPFYYSPWRYGYYPGYYGRGYSVMSTTTYRNRVQSFSRSTPMTRTNTRSFNSTSRSPNTGKSASNIRAPLKNPTSSQKSFQSRNPSKSLKSGGFGKSSKSSRPSVRRSSRSGGSRRGK